MSAIPMGAHAAFKVRDQFFGAGPGKQQQSSSFQQQVPTGDNGNIIYSIPSSVYLIYFIRF